MTAVLLTGAVVLALLGLPLFLVILAITLLGQDSVGLQAPVIFVEIFDRITDNPIFLTIPLFAHAGFVLSESRAPERLVELSRSALGFLPGGSSLVALFACALFTAFTGASGVTIIALGGLLLPLLLQERYSERFSLGLLTTGGSLGLLFPPSLPLIIFALIASNIAPVPVETLFIAGFVPGLLLLLALGLYGSVVGARTPRQERTPFQPARVLRAVRAAAFELPVPVIVIGGIFGGFLTLAQAAAAVALYVSFVEVYVYRDLDVRKLGRVTVESMVMVGGVLIIIMAALAMTNLLTDQEIPRRILEAMRGHLTSPLAFLLFLNLFLLAVGCLMDIFSAILVVVPLVLPIALDFGIDPVHLGIIILANLEIGYSTPPVGINLFIASLRFRRPVVALYSASLPFLGILLVCLGFITYLPGLSLGLVRALEGTSSVEVAWARRSERGTVAGEATLRWGLRTAEGLEWEDTAPPHDGAAEARSSDLQLHVTADDSGLEPLLRFELARAEAETWSVTARWSAPGASVEELTGFRGSLEDGRVREATFLPPDPVIRALELEPGNWTAGEVEIHEVTERVVRGSVRATLVHFPEDEDQPEEVYDFELLFEAPVREERTIARPVPPGARAQTVPDVRLSVQEHPDGARFRLERTRSRPWDLQASWSARRDAEVSEMVVDGVQLSLENVPEEELPWRAGEIVAAHVVFSEETAAHKVGSLLAVLRSPSGAEYHLEIRFDHEVRPRND